MPRRPSGAAKEKEAKEERAVGRGSGTVLASAVGADCHRCPFLQKPRLKPANNGTVVTGEASNGKRLKQTKSPSSAIVSESSFEPRLWPAAEML
ncbi:hypothetical protein SAMN02927923_02044 [Microvirga guangxiensis]|uniref:Uncharacterized protein n=1 Tax=Microvirga guangxiensis TaxID=549386 RepID=A0A1G5I2T2_9HYPH|nr:hypothetical protein SAMN02927923_02044 [Microvirga guangxiensis]